MEKGSKNGVRIGKSASDFLFGTNPTFRRGHLNFPVGYLLISIAIEMKSTPFCAFRPPHTLFRHTLLFRVLNNQAHRTSSEIFGNRMIGRSGNSANRKVGVFFAGSPEKSWGICRRFELEKLPDVRFGRSNMSILHDIFMNIVLTCSGVFCMAISGDPAAVHSCVPDRCRCRAAAVCGGFRSAQIVGAVCRPAAGRSGRFSGWYFRRSAFRRLSGRGVRLVSPRFVLGVRSVVLGFASARLVSPRLPLGGWSVGFRSGWYAGRLPLASARLRLGSWRLGMSAAGRACFASAGRGSPRSLVGRCGVPLGSRPLGFCWGFCGWGGVRLGSGLPRVLWGFLPPFLPSCGRSAGR